MAEPVLNEGNMNPQVKKMQYAVRGPIVQRAAEIEQDLQKVRLPCFLVPGS